MLRDLRQLCDRYPDLEPDQLRGAARMLLERQFLFLERPRDREPYRLLVNHFDYFLNLFDALGWTLRRDDDFALIGLVPTDTESHTRLYLVDSLLVLCLRLLYEEGMDQFAVQSGSVYVETETLLGRYETLLGRPRPRLPDLREILRRLARYGILEVGETGTDELPRLRILPSIRLVTDARVQERLTAYRPDDDEDPAADPDAEESLA